MISRRNLLQSAAASIALQAIALPVAARDLIGQIYGETKITQSRVSISVPSLVENGNSVALEVSVADLSDASDPNDVIEEIKIVAPKNPEPLLATFSFGSAAGIPKVRTRVRLADSQEVTAVARTRGGQLFSASKKTVITLAACVEPLL